MLARVVLLALAFTLSASAQTPAPDAEAVDVHVLVLETGASDLVPSVRIAAGARLAPDGPKPEIEFASGPVRFTAQVDWRKDARPKLTRRIGRSTISAPVADRTVDVSDVFRWGRRSRRGARLRGAMLCEPVAPGAGPFVALDPRGFLQKLADVLLEPEGPVRVIEHDGYGYPPQWKAALVLGSVPLREYLDPGRIEQILALAGNLPEEIDDDSVSYARPAIVLGHAGAIAAHARLPENAEDVVARAGEGDLVAPVPRRLEDAVLVAYATAADPATRGLAGWVALGTSLPDAFEMLDEDLRAGRAILPGSEPVKAALAAHLLRTRAWRSIKAPAVTLAASAAGIAGIMLLLRLATRRLL